MKEKNKKTDDTWESIYNKYKREDEENILSIDKNAKLTSNMSNFLKEHGIVFGILNIILIIVLLVTFRENLKTFLYCMIFIFISYLYFIISATYKLVFKTNKVEIQKFMHKIQIQYRYLLDIYIDRKKESLFFVKFYIYSINIVYISNNVPLELTLPTIFVRKKDAEKMFFYIQKSKKR